MIEIFKNINDLPSPLIVEGPSNASILDQLNARVLCKTRTLCGQCPACIKVKKGFHPDLIALKEFSMEDIRDALLKLHQRPYEADFRVLALYDFEAASPAVQNALLKTLEEPSPRWKIWLGTQSKMALLSTIRSRCLVLKTPTSDQSPLEGSDLELFESIAQKNEFEITSSMESVLKDRIKARSAFVRLLSYASAQSYPGHWKSLAPWMEESLADLTRNLNPRIVWERIWSQSLKA